MQCLRPLNAKVQSCFPINLILTISSNVNLYATICKSARVGTTGSQLNATFIRIKWTDWHMQWFFGVSPSRSTVHHRCGNRQPIFRLSPVDEAVAQGGLYGVEAQNLKSFQNRSRGKWWNETWRVTETELKGHANLDQPSAIAHKIHGSQAGPLGCLAEHDPLDPRTCCSPDFSCVFFSKDEDQPNKAQPVG